MTCGRAVAKEIELQLEEVLSDWCSHLQPGSSELETLKGYPVSTGARHAARAPSKASGALDAQVTAVKLRVEQEAQCPAQGSSSSHLEAAFVAVRSGNTSPRLTRCKGCPGHIGCCWMGDYLEGICWAPKFVQGPAHELLQRTHQHLVGQLLTDFASSALK